MSDQTPTKKPSTPPAEAPTSGGSYQKSLAKQKRLKRMRRMKLKDRAGDVPVSEVSDVEVLGEIDEEPQDAWLNDLLGGSDGDKLASMEVSKTPTLSPKPSETVAARICAFTNENSALLGFGIATVVITLFASIRR